MHELELLDKKWKNALIHLQAYQNRLYGSYKKRVWVRNFEIGDLVLKDNPKNQMDQEKDETLEPNWLGPCIIRITYGSSAYQLSTLIYELLIEPTNSAHLRKYYT